jgi:hypothetical protein
MFRRAFPVQLQADVEGFVGLDINIWRIIGFWSIDREESVWGSGAEGKVAYKGI